MNTHSAKLIYPIKCDENTTFEVIMCLCCMCARCRFSIARSLVTTTKNSKSAFCFSFAQEKQSNQTNNKTNKKV